MSPARTRLLALLAPVVEGTGADLEDLTVTPAGRRRVVRVVVDRDGGIGLGAVADLSRVLSEALDDVDAREPALLGGAYVLEVSSPGVDRPLTEPRHWRRAVGRLVRVRLRRDNGQDGGQDGELLGRVLRLDGEAVAVLAVDGVERAVPLAQVDRAAVQVEFDRRPGPEVGEHDDGSDADGAGPGELDQFDGDGPQGQDVAGSGHKEAP